MLNVPVHMRGTVSDGATQVTTVDVVATGTGDARCTVVEGRETLDVVRVGGMDYIRTSERVWSSLRTPGFIDPAKVTRADGRYVRAPMRMPELGALIKFLDASRSLADELVNTETATTGATVTINGVPTVAVTAVTPGLSPLPIGTIYVATVGEPYVIRWVAPGDADALDFSDHGKPVVIGPPAGDIVDLDELRAR
jgi:hypothetical protein